MSVTDSHLPSYALCSPELVEVYRKQTEEGHWALLSYEVFWRERYDYLKTRGYLLRTRFHPGWTPSWLGTNRDPTFCEDSICSMVRRAAHDHSNRHAKKLHLDI